MRERAAASGAPPSKTPRVTPRRSGIQGREAVAGWLFIAPMVVILGLFLAGLLVRGWLRGFVRESLDLVGLVLGVAGLGNGLEVAELAQFHAPRQTIVGRRRSQFFLICGRTRSRMTRDE